jgi:hypothetical protein
VNTLSSDLVTIDSRAGQLAPVIDNRGLTWTLPTKANEALQVHDATGKLVLSAGGWLSQGEHLGFGVSREGARLAVLIKTKAGTAVYVAGIKRDELGKPVGIYSPRRVALGAGTLKSLSWSGPNSLAAVAIGNSMGDIPTSILVGGGIAEMATMTESKTFVAQTDSSSSFVLDKNGILFEYRGMSWFAVETGVIAAHFIGN